MITYYRDDKIKLEFSQEPQTITREICNPLLTSEQREEYLKKPYLLLKSVILKVTYKKQVSFIYIPENYVWNGANYLDEPEFRLASMVHDWLCEHHEDSRNDRYLSSLIFVCLLAVAGVEKFKQFLMFHSVDNFQKVFGKDLKGNRWQ
jgi:hypothetical protein